MPKLIKLPPKVSVPLTTEAISRLGELMRNHDETIALEACKAILDAAGFRPRRLHKGEIRLSAKNAKILRGLGVKP